MNNPEDNRNEENGKSFPKENLIKINIDGNDNKNGIDSNSSPNENPQNSQTEENHLNNEVLKTIIKKQPI